MRVYIAGKITGLPNYKQYFDKAQKQYKKLGHTVLNPTILPEGLTWNDYMCICLSMIDVCDTVHFLPNWQQSRGARLEYKYAKAKNKNIVLGNLDDLEVEPIAPQIQGTLTTQELEKKLKEKPLFLYQPIENGQADIEKIATYYGLDSRFTQTTEELSELIQAICKYQRYASDDKCNYELLHNIYEEIADVEIMTAQLKFLLKCNEDVDKEKQGKFDRTLKGIELDKEREKCVVK